MAVSALVNAPRNPKLTDRYRAVIADAPIVVSFMTITELRYGALRAGWGELRRRGLERDLAQFVIVQPDDALIRICAAVRATAERAGLGLGHKIQAAEANRQSLSGYVVDRLAEVVQVLGVAGYVDSYAPPRRTGVSLEGAVQAVREVREAS